MVKKEIKVLYVYKHNRSFVKRDLEMLSKHFDVRPLFFNFFSFLLLPFGVYWSDVIFIWFASYHAFFSTLWGKLLGKKMVVVTGGYDVAAAPQIDYGLMRSSWIGYMVKFVLRHADTILAVSEFNRKEIYRHTGIKGVKVVYNSIDHQKFRPEGEKEDIIITVGFISTDNMKRKGLETFIRAAKYLPNVRFILIGKAEDNSIEYLNSIATPNIEFTGFVTDDELLEWYQRAKVYCQLSYYESFGMAAAEAMLCECVPVVTRKGALPEVVGETGFYVVYGDEKATANAIKKALNSQSGVKAKERIKECFSYGIREGKLVKIVEGL